jgi:phage-related protein
MRYGRKARCVAEVCGTMRDRRPFALQSKISRIGRIRAPWARFRSRNGVGPIAGILDGATGPRAIMGRPKTNPYFLAFLPVLYRPCGDGTIYGTIPSSGDVMEKLGKKTPVIFYKTKTGRDVVADWFRSLEKEDRRIIGQDLMRTQYRWPVGMPLCRPLGKGLWEVRSNLPSNRIARVMFCFRDEHLVVLHGFIKKTQKTPADDLALARTRKDEIS